MTLSELLGVVYCCWYANTQVYIGEIKDGPCKWDVTAQGCAVQLNSTYGGYVPYTSINSTYMLMLMLML